MFENKKKGVDFVRHLMTHKDDMTSRADSS